MVESTAALASIIAATIGVAGALTAIFKVGPQRSSIMVSTAESVAVMVRSELDECEKDRRELRASLETLERVAREHGWRV